MSAKEYRSGRQTKKWILETAIDLFNRHGVHAVSTKRIAGEMGISPGNLYYHFSNKEKIIREIFKQMSLDFSMGQEDDSQPPLVRFFNMIRNILLLWKRCPFFQKELTSLLNKDEELKSLYMRDKHIFKGKTKHLFQQMIDAGLMREHAAADGFESLFTIGWLITDFWISFIEINGGSPTEENLFKGIDLIMEAWRPYLSPEAIVEFRRFKETMGS